MDMVNPPAEYTAANANPTTDPETSATSAATALQNRGKTIKGQKGGRFLFSFFLRLFSFGVVSASSGGLLGGAAFRR